MHLAIAKLHITAGIHKTWPDSFCDLLSPVEIDSGPTPMIFAPTYICSQLLKKKELLMNIYFIGIVDATFEAKPMPSGQVRLRI